MPKKQKYTKAEREAFKAKFTPEQRAAYHAARVGKKPKMALVETKQVSKNTPGDAVLAAAKHIPVVGPIVSAASKIAEIAKPKRVEPRVVHFEETKHAISELGPHIEKLGMAQKQPSLTSATAPIASNYSTTMTNGGPKYYTRSVVKHQGVYRGVIRIKHREPMGPLPGTASYAVFQQPLNPANPALCPWLAGISPKFDLYCFKSAELQVETEEAATHKGRIGVNFDYEATDPVPVDRISFEQQAGTVVGPPTRNFRARMRPVKAQKYYYVGDNGTNEDPRVTNQGLISYFTVDCDDTTNNVELWFAYDVVLMEPSSQAASGGNANGYTGTTNWLVSGALFATGGQNNQFVNPTPGSNSSAQLYTFGNAVGNTTEAFRFWFPMRNQSGGFVGIPGSYTLTFDVQNTAGYNITNINVVDSTDATLVRHVTTYNGCSSFAAGPVSVNAWAHYSCRYDVLSAWGPITLNQTMQNTTTVGAFVVINVTVSSPFTSGVTVFATLTANSKSLSTIVSRAVSDEKSGIADVTQMSIISSFDGVQANVISRGRVSIPPRMNIMSSRFVLSSDDSKCVKRDTQRRDSQDFVDVKMPQREALVPPAVARWLQDNDPNKLSERQLGDIGDTLSFHNTTARRDRDPSQERTPKLGVKSVQ
jgi:hypothetical protein